MSRAGLGGKADGLVALLAAGEDVPPFLVVTSGPEPGAPPSAPGTSGHSVPTVPADAVAEPGAPRLLAALERTFAPADTVAVRSSAVGEDGEELSFAGQFASWLDVAARDVPARVADCLASAGAGGVRRYLDAHGAPATPVVMNVVVQRMVDAEMSGVVFTADPRGLLNETVVTVGRGRGDDVVGNRVPTTTYHRNTTDGQSYFETAEGAPLLDRDTLDAVVDLGRRAREVLGRHVDVEFAVEAGSAAIRVLQARPITTLADGPVVTLDNSNIVESYPGITLPLTASFVAQAYHGVFRGLVLRVARDERVAESFEPVLREMVACSSGRMYYRLDNWYRLLRLLPMSGRIIPVWQDMLGVGNRELVGVDAGPVGPSDPTPLRRLRTYLAVVREFLGTPRGMRRLETEFTAVRDLFAERIADDLDTAALHGLYREIERRLLRGWDVTLLNDLHAFVFTGLVRARLRGRVADPRAAVTELVSGIADLASMEPVRAMAGLAAEAPVEELAAIGTEDRAAAYLAGEGDFPRRLRDYVERYGDRYLEELKLESPTFRTDPLLLLRTLVGYRSAAGRPAGSLPGSADADPARAVRGPLTRWLVRRAARGIEYRESSRLNRARVYGMVRTIFLRVGANLAREGRIASAADVFWLTTEEAFAAGATGPERAGTGAGAGAVPGEDLKRVVARRKADHEVFRRLPAFSRLVFAGAPFDRHHANVDAVDVAEPGDDLLRGVPVSGGVVRGRVRVVRDPRHAVGGDAEILVTPMTDPGWVFLLTTALGVISERGSLLSHTSIVARELGVPSVVGVRGVTGRLRDGDLVELDGDRGLVRILDRGTDGPGPDGTGPGTGRG